MLQLDQYLHYADLSLRNDSLLFDSVEYYLNKFRGAIDEAIDGEFNIEENLLYFYQVPTSNSDGSCSVTQNLETKPYDLSIILGGRNSTTTQRLFVLNLLVKKVADITQVDWLGIYQSRTKKDGLKVLVKLAYQGIASRAEFPLTAEFAAKSNNSTVGISGKAKIINDVPLYLELGGSYYTCDIKVLAEACLPLIADESGNVVGIIDIEAHSKNFFVGKTLSPLLALCFLAAEYLPS